MQGLKREFDHCRAADFAECTDMRQARGAVARLERDIALCGGDDLATVHCAQTFNHALSLFKRPCAGFVSDVLVDGLCHCLMFLCVRGVYIAQLLWFSMGLGGFSVCFLIGLGAICAIKLDLLAII